MRLLPYILAVAAFGQATTPFKVSQGGATAGAVWLQEPRSGGVDWLKLRAGTMAADVTFTLPIADGQANDCLQTDGAGQWQWAACNSSAVDVITTDYDWTQAPGGSLTAATPATVTLTPCPDGIAPYSTHHNVRVKAGTGTAETVLLTGVTGSGATCDIDFTPANNHSGAWTIGSASKGIHEAARMVTSAKRLFIALGQQDIDEPAPGEESTIYIQQGITIAGAGNDPGTGSYIRVEADQWAIIFDTVYPIHASNFAVGSDGTQTSGGGIKLTAAAASHNCWSVFEDLQLSQLYDGIHLERGCATLVRNNFFSAYSNHGLRMENVDIPDAGDQSVTGNYFQIVGSSGIGTTAIKWLSAGGARIVSNKFNTQGSAIDLESNTNTIIAAIVANSFDNQTEYSVKVRAPSPDSFAFVNISSNIFTGAGASGYKAIDIGDTTDDIDNVSIVGNNMQGDGTAIRIGSADKVTIDGNTIGLYATGIQTTSDATQVSLGQNTLYSLTTKYSLASDANIRPTAPLFVSGYSRSWSSGSNIQAIAEFAEPSVGSTANNAIMFLNGSTGADTQRGIWWSYSTGDLNFARFGTAKTAAPSTDLTLQTDGDAQFNYKVGIGRSPSTGVALDVNGTIRSTDGTIILQSYVSGGAGYFGTETNHPVLVTQDNTVRLRLTNSALLPETLDAFNSGDPTRRWLGTYSKIFDSVDSGGTGDYMQTRKLQLFDNTGSSTGASFWDLNVVMSGAGAGQNSYFYLRDNGGNTVWRADKIASGSAVATTTIYTDLVPDSTANARKLGKTTQRWDEINGASIDLSGGANIIGNLSAAVINATGSPAYRVSGTTVIDASRNLSNIGTGGFTGPITVTNSGPALGAGQNLGNIRATGGSGFVSFSLYRTDDTNGGWLIGTSGLAAGDFAIYQNQGAGSPTRRLSIGTTGAVDVVGALTSTALTINTGAATVGYVWTATSTGGAGSWQASGGGSSLPVVDTTGISKGSSDATKIVRFEVDGLTTATTRVMTVPDTDMVLAGRNVAQTFSAAQTVSANLSVTSGSSLLMDRATRATNQQAYWTVAGNPSTTGAWAIGTVPNGAASEFRVTHNGTAVITSGEGGQVDFAGVVTTGGALTVTGAATANRFNATSTNPFQVSGTTVIDSSRNASFVGLTLNGSITGDLIPATSAVYVIGSSSFLWNNIHADTVTVYTNLIPDASASANLGGATKRWTKTWTADLDITGTVIPPSGTAFTGTKTVRDAAGTGTCTLTYSSGIMTGGTC